MTSQTQSTVLSITLQTMLIACGCRGQVQAAVGNLELEEKPGGGGRSGGQGVPGTSFVLREQCLDLRAPLTTTQLLWEVCLLLPSKPSFV